jgi:predicted enzyme related to lactoylglutathione lyase
LQSRKEDFSLEIGIILLKVRDFQNILSFYRDTLSLPVSMLGEDFARFGTRACTVEIFPERPGDGIPLPRNNAVTIAFKVANIRNVCDNLKRRGVEFTKDVTEEKWGWYAHFRDPEGNKLQLFELRIGSDD